MELEKAIKIIKDIDTSDDYELQEAYNTVFQELDRLQKENEELKKRFKRYGDVDLVKLAQIKEIEDSVPKFYIDKKTYENLLKEE